MKKLLYLLILIPFVITSGCTNYESKAKKIIGEYYKKNRLVTSEDQVTLIKAKPYKDVYLVLAEYNPGDGQKKLDLLMVKNDRNKYYVSREAQGMLPSDSNFSLNELSIDGSTVLFGVFDDSIVKNKNTVLTKLLIKQSDKNTYEENVAKDSGYVVILDGNHDLTEMSLLDQNGKTVSSKTDLSKDNQFIYMTKFLLTR